MNNLTLTAAFGDYDRTAMLQKGTVRPEGIDLRIITMRPIEIFHRMSRFPEFEVSEMSMGTHCYLSGAGDSPFVGMPAFPSRVFRHSMVYVNVDAGIEKPEDLNGKRIAIHEWGMTAVVWIMGIMGEEYGLDLTSVDWQIAIRSRVPIQMPANTKIRYLETGQNISDMLESGEVDAAFLHQVPPCFAKGSPRVQRLFPDYKSAEIEFYQRTGIHPIMHCVILRKDIYRQYPWALSSLYKAFCEVRQKVMDALNDNSALFAMIPLLPSVMEETHKIFGQNFWPYGINANRKTLEKLVLYACQQGLTPRLLDVEELFAANIEGL